MFSLYSFICVFLRFSTLFRLFEDFPLFFIYLLVCLFESSLFSAICYGLRRVCFCLPAPFFLKANKTICLLANYECVNNYLITFYCCQLISKVHLMIFGYRNSTQFPNEFSDDFYSC